MQPIHVCEFDECVPQLLLVDKGANHFYPRDSCFHNTRVIMTVMFIRQNFSPIRASNRHNFASQILHPFPLHRALISIK